MNYLIKIFALLLLLSLMACGKSSAEPVKHVSFVRSHGPQIGVPPDIQCTSTDLTLNCNGIDIDLIGTAQSIIPSDWLNPQVFDSTEPIEFGINTPTNEYWILLTITRMTNGITYESTIVIFYTGIDAATGILNTTYLSILLDH